MLYNIIQYPSFTGRMTEWHQRKGKATIILFHKHPEMDMPGVLTESQSSV
jgi:hypothetical protein